MSSRLFNSALLRKVKTAVLSALLASSLPLRAFAADTIDPVPLDSVPEPDTLALVGATVAIIALILLFRRKRRGK